MSTTPLRALPSRSVAGALALVPLFTAGLLLDHDQVTALLHERQNKQVKRAPKGAAAGPTPVAAHRALAAQRKELNQLVSAYARQKGYPHANVHADLRRPAPDHDEQEHSA